MVALGLGCALTACSDGWGTSWSAPTSVTADVGTGSPGMTALPDGVLSVRRVSFPPGGGTRPLSAGALLVLPDGSRGARVYHRDADPENRRANRWARIATLPTTFDGFDATNNIRGQPQIAVAPLRRGSNLEWHAWVTVSTATPAGPDSLVLRSVAGLVSFTGRRWGYVNAGDVFRTSSPSSVLRDDREESPLLRGIVSRLHPRRPSPCPSGLVSGTWESASVCISPDGRYLLVEEWRSGEFDGTTPGTLESFNEWPTLLHYFCEGVRQQRPVAPSPWDSESGSACPDAPTFP